MALPVYSTRFIRFTGLNSPSYTVPAGFVAVVRHATFVGGGPGAVATALYGSAGVPSEAFWQGVQAANQSLLFEGRIVLNAGESFFLTSSSSCAMTAHGYLLSV